MASNIKTPEDLLNILDAIFSNQTTEKYNPMRLYIDAKTKTAKIFMHQETKNKVLYSAVLDPEGFIIGDDNFLVRTYQSCIAPNVGGVGTVYDVGVGAYVDIDLLVKNISKCLGVKLSDDIATKSPSIYNDLVNIILSYYTEETRLQNNFPVLIKKQLQDEDVSYKSFIPAMLFIEFSIYFNNLNLFNTEYDINQPYFIQQDKDFVGKTMSKNNFINLFDKFNTDGNLEHRLRRRDLLDKFLDLYGNELDFENSVIVLVSTYYTLFESNSARLIINVVPNTCKISNMSSYNCSNKKISGSEAPPFEVTNDNEYTLIKYTISKDYNREDLGYTHTKDVSLKDANLVSNLGGSGTNAGSFLISNLSVNGLYTTYDYLTLGHFSIPSYNTYYKLSDFSLLSTKEFMGRVTYIESLEKIVNHFGLNLDGKLCFYITRRPQDTYGRDKYSGILFVYEDLDEFKWVLEKPISDSSKICEFSWKSSPYKYQLWDTSDHNIYDNNYSSMKNSSSTSDFIESDEDYNVSFYIYDINKDSYSKFEKTTKKFVQGFSNEVLEDLFESSNSFITYNNLGKFIQINSAAYPGVSLISGATYPFNITSVSDLERLFPDWFNYDTSNPYKINNVLYAPTLTHYLACSISNRVETQEDAQAALLMTDDIEDIIRDIDLATDDDDGGPDVPPDPDPGEEPDVDPNDDKPSDNVGDTPDIENINKLPNVIGAGALKQYRLTLQQVQSLFSNLNSNDTWTAISKFISNPINFIISFQAGYACQHVGESLENIRFGPYEFNESSGYKLNSNWVDLSAGTIDLSPYFDNYTDITNTDIQLYLPYVGYVPLDVDKFIGGSINITCRIDTLTGSIVYFVYSVRDNHTQLLNTFDGNCQMQIPINSSDFSRLYGALFGTATALASGGTSALLGASQKSYHTVNALRLDNQFNNEQRQKDFNEVTNKGTIRGRSVF